MPESWIQEGSFSRCQRLQEHDPRQVRAVPEVLDGLSHQWISVDGSLLQFVNLTSGQGGEGFGNDLDTEGQGFLSHVRISSVESKELSMFQSDLSTLMMTLLKPDSLIEDLRGQLGLSSPFFFQDLLSLVSVSWLNDAKPVQFVDWDMIRLVGWILCKQHRQMPLRSTKSPLSAKLSLRKWMQCSKRCFCLG